MAKIIGITGGVGAGKSAVLSYLVDQYKYTVIQADQVAHEVKEKGSKCYQELVHLLGEDVLDEIGQINHSKMADKIFQKKELLDQVNQIIHPAVKESILQAIQGEKGTYLFIEAALLIESGYLPYLDELWYIYADESIRTIRLMEQRGYAQEKVECILKAQLTDAEYRKHCTYMIDNSKDVMDTYKQIDAILQKEKA